MMNKIFGCKSITHLLYGVAILLPMMSILGRVCYTVVNKNAKDSYSNLNSFVYKYETNEVNSTQDLIEGNIYTFNLQDGFTDVCRVGLSSILIDEDLDYYNFKNISLEYDTTIRTHYNYNGVTYDTFVVVPYNDTTNVYTIVNKVNFIYGNSSFNSNLYNLLPCISKCENIPVEEVSNTSGYLDNAFEYSLQTFVDDNNLGNVNLFSWFTDLFLDQSKPKNALYLNFVNWYLNYTLLVSSGYLLFMVMIWFTQYIRRIMDKSMYQDFGGF